MGQRYSESSFIHNAASVRIELNAKCPFFKMMRGEAAMKLRTHVVLALLQFVSACLGVLGHLLLGGMLGYVELLWWGGKALIVPLFALEGLGLAVIPSYVFAFRIL